MEELYGKWFYAEDPKGEIALNSFYEGGSITLTAEGGYKMEMKSGGYALEGTYTVRSTSAEEVVIETAYSGGRTNVLTFGLRREGSEVVGMTLAETEDKVPTRYYQRGAPKP
jgi:hypothetical protein